MSEWNHLRPWERPQYWIGHGSAVAERRARYYVGLAQTRDSNSWERSNFQVFLKALEALEVEDGPEACHVERDGHFLCGWVEVIYVNPEHRPACLLAESMLEALTDYPILDEDRHSEMVWDEACEVWERMGLRERIDTIASDCNGEASIFAARRNELPEGIDTHSLVDGC